MTDPQATPEYGPRFIKHLERMRARFEAWKAADRARAENPLTPEEQHESDEQTENTRLKMARWQQERHANMTPEELAAEHQRDREQLHFMLGQRNAELNMLTRIAVDCPLPDPEDVLSEIDQRYELLDQWNREDGIHREDDDS